MLFSGSDFNTTLLKDKRKKEYLFVKLGDADQKSFFLIGSKSVSKLQA